MEFNSDIISNIRILDIANLEKFILEKLNKDDERSMEEILDFLSLAHVFCCRPYHISGNCVLYNYYRKDDKELFHGFDKKIFKLFTDENLMERLLEVFSSYLDDILKQYKENINNTNIDNGSKEKIHKFMEGLQCLLCIPSKSIRDDIEAFNIINEDTKNLIKRIVDNVAKMSIKLIEEDLELDLYYDYMFNIDNYQIYIDDDNDFLMSSNLFEYLYNKIDNAILTKFTNMDTLKKIIKEDKKIIPEILKFVFMASSDHSDYFNGFFQRFAQNIINEKDSIVQQIGTKGLKIIIKQLLGSLPILMYDKTFFEKYEYLNTVIDMYNMYYMYYMRYIYYTDHNKNLEKIKKLFYNTEDFGSIDYIYEQIVYDTKYACDIIEIIDNMNKQNNLSDLFNENINIIGQCINNNEFPKEKFEHKIIQQVLICYILKKSNYEYNSILNMLTNMKDVFNEIFEHYKTNHKLKKLLVEDTHHYYYKDNNYCYNIKFFIKHINDYFPELEQKHFFSDIENYSKDEECYSIDYEKVNNSFVEILVYEINKIYSSNKNINYDLIHNIFEKIVSSENYGQPHNLMYLIKCVSDIKDKKILNHFKEILYKCNKSEYIEKLEENEEIRSRKRSAQDVYKNESPIEIMQLPEMTLQPRQNILQSSRSMLQPNLITEQQLGLDITSQINGILVQTPIMLMQNNNLNNIDVANNFAQQDMELYEHINDSIDEFDSINKKDHGHD